MSIFIALAILSSGVDQPRLELKGIRIRSTFDEVLSAQLGRPLMLPDGCTYETGGKKLCIYKNGTLAAQVANFSVRIAHGYVCSISSEFDPESFSVIKQTLIAKYGGPGEPDPEFPDTLTWRVHGDVLEMGKTDVMLYNESCEAEVAAAAQPSKDI